MKKIIRVDSLLSLSVISHESDNEASTLNPVPTESRRSNEIRLSFLIEALYFIPSIVADARGCTRDGEIFILNLFLGWTLLGWIAALVWAISCPTKKEWSSKQKQLVEEQEPPNIKPFLISKI